MTRLQLAQQFYENLMGARSSEITSELSIEVYPDYRVLRLDGRFSSRPKDFEIVLVDVSSREVVYYLDVALLGSHVGVKPLIHALPFRTTNADHQVALEGFSSSLMYDYLIPKYVAVLADGNQTAGGIFLWSSKISEATYYNRNAYFIESNGAMRRLTTQDDHQALSDELWSAGAEHNLNLAAIAQNELPDRIDTEPFMPLIIERMKINTSLMVLGQGNLLS